MIVTELLRKKRNGLALSPAELAFLVKGFSSGEIPDYQIAAWLMASFLKGMDTAETTCLTRLMKESGDTLNWRELDPNLRDAHFADKHSTGGVGDKVSLVLTPLAVLLDLKIPMMSGRGLGHTGGTADKLGAIAGLNLKPDTKTMLKSLNSVGACMLMQSERLCPADRKLYALRDVTSTVESLPLITASIVSKKWAEGVDALVIDVKCGTAAFMEDLFNARALSESLVRTAGNAGIKASAVISRMDEPLGCRIGNALEVDEVMWILRNEAPSPEHRRLLAPLVDLICELSAEMAILAGTRDTLVQAKAECHNNLCNGKALEVFEKLLKTQGAKDNWEALLPRAPKLFSLRAGRSGYLHEVRSRELGLAGLSVGMGRLRAEEAVDPATGFEIHVSPGDPIQEDQVLLTAFLHSTEQWRLIEDRLQTAFRISYEQTAAPTPLFLQRILKETL